MLYCFVAVNFTVESSLRPCTLMFIDLPSAVTVTLVRFCAGGRSVKFVPTALGFWAAHDLGIISGRSEDQSPHERAEPSDQFPSIPVLLRKVTSRTWFSVI
jgi:hypothetical protein